MNIRDRRWFFLTVVFGILLILIFLICCQSIKHYNLSNDIVVERRFRKILFALRSYHDEKGHYPPVAHVGRTKDPLLSWRVLILPYLGELELYDRFEHDEAWDSPKNSALIKKMPSVYSRPGFSRLGGKTFVQAIKGKNAGFSLAKELSNEDFTENDTILIAESADQVYWTAPIDIDVDTKVSFAHFFRSSDSTIGKYWLQFTNWNRFIVGYRSLEVEGISWNCSHSTLTHQIRRTRE